MTELTTGQRIAQHRKLLGLSQEGLGEKVGVSRQAISKWEADAVLPDVDKLIILSKLFGVSIGWLLGVEEMPRNSPESPPISEELLRKIEEVVRRYQPPRKRFTLAKAILLALAVILAVWVFVTDRQKREAESSMLRFTYAQVDLINEQNANILLQLAGLESRIEDISTAAKEAAAVLASSHFQITPDMEEGTALLEIRLVPKTWKEDWSAQVLVHGAHSQPMPLTCAWYGNSLNASVRLPLEDGYAFWLVIRYPDGTQEQIQLENQQAQNLKTETSILCEIGEGSLVSWDLDRGGMAFKGYDVHLAQPRSMVPVNWEKAEFVLYHILGNERQVCAIESLPQSVMKDSLEFWAGGDLYVDIPQMQEGDRLELWFEAALENGMSVQEKLDEWIFTTPEGFVPAQ